MQRDAMAGSSKPEYFVGVDLGATKILAGVFRPSLECVAESKLSTKGPRGDAAVNEPIARCVRDAVDEADLNLNQIRGVGVGAPGAVEGQSGSVIFAPNLDWYDVPLKHELEEQLGLPVFVGNDCTMAMQGVYVSELKSEPENVVGIFLGTGIGGGLIINGKPRSTFFWRALARARRLSMKRQVTSPHRWSRISPPG